MTAVFVTATGTDIGKTYLAAGLVRHFRNNGKKVEAIKPVMTGFDAARATESDAGILLSALSRPITAGTIARISPWRFAAPLSPDLAARREGRALDFDALVDYCRKAMREHEGTLLIEGIGGIMVPLDAHHTVLDWMGALRLPLLLVAGSYLGSISHTLTCLDILRRRDLLVRALIINETLDTSVTVGETIESIAHFAQGIPIIGLMRERAQANSATFAEISKLIE
jgi:dethiobiotin synthetase